MKTFLESFLRRDVRFFYQLRMQILLVPSFSRTQPLTKTTQAFYDLTTTKNRKLK